MWEWRKVWTLEAWVTLALAVLLIGLVLWRLDILDRGPDWPRLPERPALIVAVWPEGQGLVSRAVLVPGDHLAALADGGGLFAAIHSLPGVALEDGRFRVFRLADETEIVAGGEAAAVARGNRCLLALDTRVIAAMGGPLTAVVSVRAQLPAVEACELDGGPAGAAG